MVWRPRARKGNHHCVVRNLVAVHAWRDSAACTRETSVARQTLWDTIGHCSEFTKQESEFQARKVALGNKERNHWKMRETIPGMSMKRQSRISEFGVPGREGGSGSETCAVGRQCLKIGKWKKWNSVFFCQRHVLSTSFDIFVVTYRVTNFVPKLVNMLLFSVEKTEFPFFEIPYFRVLPCG